MWFAVSRKSVGFLSALCIAVGFGASAKADNINSPDYAFGPCSTHTVWTPAGGMIFTTSGPVSPFAAPPHAPCPFPLATGALAPPPSFAPTSGGIHFELPNFDDRLPIKLLRVQVTLDRIVEAPPEDPGFSMVFVFGHDPEGAGTTPLPPSALAPCPDCADPTDWYYFQDFVIEPNPDWEEVDIIFGGPYAGIAQVVIDTISTVAQVPEPGTLALIGLGLAGLGVIRRRRAA